MSFTDWHYSSGWETWPKNGPAHGGQWKNWALDALITKTKGAEVYKLIFKGLVVSEHTSLEAAKAAALPAQEEAA